MLTPLSLPVQSEPGRYNENTRLINMMPEERGAAGKIPFPLYAVNGLASFATLTGGGGYRGGISLGDVGYVVSGRQVFKVDSAGSSTSLGGFAGDDQVYLSRNQKAPNPQIVLVSQGKRAIIENDILLNIDDSDLAPPNSVAFLNQYFVFTINNGTFQWSALSEGGEYDPTDFATAEYGPDGLERALVRRGELLLFGSSTIEPWYVPSSGSSTFARSGSVVEFGTLNGATVTMLEETPVFVAHDATVRALEGYTARRISTHAVERSIRDTADQGNMEAFSVAQDGHSIYYLVGDDFTWGYDAATGQWHERQSYGLNRWVANGYLKIGGRHIVGHYNSNTLLELSPTAYDEAGTEMVCEVQVPIHAYPKRIRVNEVRLDTIPGQGTNASDEHSDNPQIMVKVSKNGGRTWGNERHYAMGRIGEYGRQVRVNRLGTSNEDGFVLSASMSADVVRGVTAAAADVDVMGV